MSNQLFKRYSTSKGFTHIELLVVIAIIALLAAILFPAFARARENARRSTCQSNLKQQSLGLMQYSQDYDERLPINSDFAPTSPKPPVYHLIIQPYVKSTRIFRCPSVQKTSLSTANKYYSTYGMPGYRSNTDNLVVYDVDGLHLSLVKEPARTWMITETAWKSITDVNYLTDGAGYYEPALDTRSVPEGGDYFSHKLHFDGSNVAFIDGHVKWIKSGDGKNWIFSLHRQ